MSTVSKPADLTAGPIAPALIRLALPLLFGNILQQLYNTRSEERRVGKEC